ncbi:hypothetical protein H5410_042557 [Solanum commersonii]|uniref:Protein ENHANCED DISEASE RESISTANCE 2 C-terminal domain-containing protein n=1 Tax=Solanum commersonii TaxID=4109 RepID=A0A9J5XUP1_SOLCO|nr:hypothetical protein H5410_042557 [Solanum commersonii]
MCSTKQKQKQNLHHKRSVVPTSTSAAGGEGGGGGDWREESITGGSLKHVDLDNGKNGWASPPGDLFNLRGPNYLTKKVKVPSGAWLLQPAGVDWLRSNSKLDHVLARHDNRVMNALKKSHSEGKSMKTFVVAVNLQVPGRDQHSAVFYFATNDDEPLEPGSLLYRFVNGDDAYRNSRFKIVNRIVKGPWIVKAAVGNYAACILGSVTSVTIDMGFLVESQTAEELPEKLFGAVRICQMEMSSATFIDTTSSRKVLPTANLHNPSNSSRVQAEENGENKDD